MPVWLAAVGGAVLLLLLLLLLLSRRTVRRLRRQVEEARLHEAQVGATDQLIEFRLRQLTEQIERLERARDEAGPEPDERSPRRRHIG